MAVGREVAEAYIDVHGDLGPFRDDLDSIKSSLDDIDARLQKAFRSDGVSSLNSNLRNSNIILDSFAKKLQGLAGLNVLEDSFRFGVKFMQEIDRNSITLAKMVTMVGTVAGEIVHLAGAAAVISQDIVALGGIGILAPGFLTGFGIAMGVTVAAMKDMSTVLADLGPSFSRLQDSISEAFWEQAAGPIRELVNGLMPTLNTQLRETARAMGGLFAEFAIALRTEATPERVTVMMQRLNAAIDIARAAIRPFTAAVVTLGEVGSEYFGRFAQAVVNVSEQFNDFIQRSAANGDLNRWVENAIQGFKDLGRMLQGAAGIIGAIGDAARAAGVGGLKEMADRLQQASDIMNSPRFQNALIQLFSGVTALTDGLVAGLGRIGPALETAMPTIQNVFGFLGQALERIGGIIAGVVSNPQFLAGLQDFAASIVAALDKLAPAVEPFASSLGGLLNLAGDVLVAVASIASTIIQEWGPVLDDMGNKLGELVGPLGEALGQVVKDLTPAFESLYENVLVPVVDIIKENVIPALEKISGEVGPLLKDIFEEIGKLLDDLKPGLDALTGGMDASKSDTFADSIRNVMDAFDGLIASASGEGPSLWEWLDSEEVKTFSDDVNNNLEAFWAGVGERFRIGWEQISAFFGSMWQPIADRFALGWQQISTAWNDFWTTIFMFVQTTWDGFVAWLTTAWTNITTAFTSFMAPIIEAWNTFWTGLVTFVQTTWDGFIAFLGTIWTSIQTGIQTFITGVQTVWDAFWNGLIALPGIVWAGIQAGVQAFVGFFTTLWTSFWNSLTPQAQSVLTNIGNFISTTWNTITAFFQTFITGVVTNWNQFWTTVFTTAQTILTNVWNFITTTVNNIANGINSFISGVVNAWNKFWGDVFNTVSKIWNDIFSTGSKSQSQISGGIQNFINGVVSAWNNFWNGVFQTVSNIWNNISNFINGAINNVRNFIQSGISGIQSTWNSIWSSISSFVSSIWNSIVSTISNFINSARNTVASVLNSIWSTMSSVWNSIWSTVSGAWNNIVSAVSQGINNVMAWVGQLPGRIAGALGGLAGQLFNAGVQMMQGMVNGIQAMLGNLVAAAQNVVGGAIDGAKRLLGIASPSKVFTKIGEQTGQGLVIGLESMGTKVASAIGTLADAAMSVIDTNMMVAAGKDAALGLAEGLEANKDKISSVLNGFGMDITANTPSVPVRAAGAETTGDATGAGAAVVNYWEKGSVVSEYRGENPTIAATKLLDKMAEVR